MFHQPEKVIVIYFQLFYIFCKNLGSQNENLVLTEGEAL